MLFCYLDKGLATTYNNGVQTIPLPMVKGKFGFEENDDKRERKKTGNPFAEP